MKEKLFALMKSEGLKSSQLAEMLEINPAGVSHILAGRNKPGFDLLQKILRRFPRINPDWLLLDSDKMYRTNTTEFQSSVGVSSVPGASTSARGIADGLFGQSSISKPATSASSIGGNPGADKLPADIASLTSAVNDSVGGRQNVAVERVVIFYTDQTFESFSPTKR